jgi:hypothetical protein
VSRNTARKVLRSGETAFSYERSVQPLPKLGPWTGELDRLLETNERKARRERHMRLAKLKPPIRADGLGLTLSSACVLSSQTLQFRVQNESVLARSGGEILTGVADTRSDVRSDGRTVRAAPTGTGAGGDFALREAA